MLFVMFTLLHGKPGCDGGLESLQRIQAVGAGQCSPNSNNVSFEMPPWHLKVPSRQY